jgi:glutaredoxin 3
MAQRKVVIYTRDWCSYCWRIRRLLKRKGYAFEEISMTNDPEGRARLAQITGRSTVPQVIVEDRPIGGFDDMKALDRSGELDRLVRMGQRL